MDRYLIPLEKVDLYSSMQGMGKRPLEEGNGYEVVGQLSLEDWSKFDS
mgnify:CR=1 FL=1